VESTSGIIDKMLLNSAAENLPKLLFLTMGFISPVLWSCKKKLW